MSTKNTKKSHCYEIVYSIESAQQKSIDFLRKDFTIQQSIDATKTAKEAGLLVMSNIIIGIPGETRRDIRNTINFGDKLNFDFIYPHILTPFPGTNLLKYAEDNNMLLTKDWSKYTTYHPILKIPGIRPFEIKGYYIMADLKFKLKRNIFS